MGDPSQLWWISDFTDSDSLGPVIFWPDVLICQEWENYKQTGNRFRYSTSLVPVTLIDKVLLVYIHCKYL